MKTRLEENTLEAYKRESFEAVRNEHPRYFEALSKHPRLLVGTQVPAIGREGFETLRDTNDAKEWQEAVHQTLTEEIQDRAARRMEESGGVLSTVHAAIELFQNNADLVPGTRGFDRTLADRFAELAAPYELRVDGKLQGYSIPVQPIIDRLRTQLQSERAAQAAPAAPAAPAGGGGPATPPAPAQPPVDPPQAGIPSKAGSGGSDGEDFSTLFGTIGLPNLRI